MEKTNQQRILVVDDIKENIEILFELLQDEYIIVAAKNGENAIKKAHKTKPDLILLDIMMPEMDGYEVCRRLKSYKETKGIPIIFVTALSEAMDEAKAFELGGIDYITKPFVSIVVKARIATHLALRKYQTNLEKLVIERTKELEISRLTAQKAQKVAEEANNAKSIFLMNMTHELRTPLNGVIACTDLIKKEQSMDQILKFNEIIESSSLALLNDIEQILEFTRSKDGNLKIEKELFKLSDALKKIQTDFLHKGRRLQLIPQIKIEENNIPDNLIGDKKHLIAILNPLLENAAKFTHEKPEAILTLKMLDKTKNKVLIQFSISDNGIGIQPDKLKKIFEPFSQADDSNKREFDGTGMGLSLSKELVELKGGKIWVESKQNKGSTFYFTIKFAIHKEDEFLNITKVNEAIQAKLYDPEKDIESLAVEIDVVEPILKKLNQALIEESDHDEILNYLNEIKKYKISKKSELIEIVDEYEYEEALSLLKEIAAEIGLQIE